MRRNVEVISCDFCGEDVECMIATAKVRVYGKGEPIEKPIRLYNQIAFNYGGTRYVYDICSKCRKKVDDGEVCVSTDMSLDRSFTGANG
jgi:hypothetical protein